MKKLPPNNHDSQRRDRILRISTMISCCLLPQTGWTWDALSAWKGAPGNVKLFTIQTWKTHPCGSKQCPAGGIWRIWQGSISRQGLLDTVYPLREHLNNVQLMVSGEYCEGVLPDTVCWTLLRRTWTMTARSLLNVCCAEFRYFLQIWGGTSLALPCDTKAVLRENYFS